MGCRRRGAMGMCASFTHPCVYDAAATDFRDQRELCTYGFVLATVAALLGRRILFCFVSAYRVFTVARAGIGIFSVCGRGLLLLFFVLFSRIPCCSHERLELSIVLRGTGGRPLRR